jgi:hypothetical protein
MRHSAVEGSVEQDREVGLHKKCGAADLGEGFGVKAAPNRSMSRMNSRAVPFGGSPTSLGSPGYARW